MASSSNTLASPLRRTQVLLRDSQFIVQETFERAVGDQQALIKKMLGSGPTFLPNEFPPLQNFCKGTHFGNYPDGRLIIVSEIEYFPLPGIVLAPLESGEYVHHYLPYGREFDYIDRARYDNVENYFEKAKIIEPANRTLRWRHPDLRMFILFVMGEDKSSLNNAAFCAFYEDRKAEKTHLVLPALPNLFADARVCMGHEEWYKLPESKDPVELAQNGLKYFETSPANADLDTGYTREILRWDKDQNLIQKDITIGRFLSDVDNELLVAFFQHMKNNEL
jgi:hypothetical protein